MSSLWIEAADSLDEPTKSDLDLFSSGGLSSVDDVISLVNRRKQECVNAQFKWKKSSGEVIVIRDVMERVANWLEKLRKIGDVAIQVDQASTALPWAGFRYLLQVTISDIKNFGSISEAIEEMTRHLLRCAAMETVVLDGQPVPSTLRGEFRHALVSFYRSVLTYLGRAAKYYATPAKKRFAAALLLVDETLDLQLKDVRSKADAVCVLISNITASLVGETHAMVTKVQGIAESTQVPIVRTYEVVDSINTSMKREEYLKTLNWVSAFPFQVAYEDNLSELVSETGMWLQDEASYLDWQRSSSSSLFWLRGSVGCGKTKITTALIKTVLGQLEVSSNITPIAYFYFSRTALDPRSTDPHQALRSILRQVSISQSNQAVHSALQDVYSSKRESAEKMGIDPSPLSMDECVDTLILIAKTKPLFIVIDALDEISDLAGRNKLIDLLQKLVGEASCIIKIFISSRPLVASGIESRRATILDIEPIHTAVDIKKFLTTRINDAQARRNLLRGQVSEELKSNIIQRVSQQAAGMFLLAALQFKRICDSDHVKLDDDVIDILNNQVGSIHEAIGMIVDQINAYSEHSRDLTYSIFRLVLSAERGLTVGEILSAIFVNGVDKKTCSPSLETVMDLCGNLILHSKNTGTLHFIHLSVQEYLLSRPEFTTSRIHLTALQSCLGVYLSEDDFEALADQRPNNEICGSNIVPKTFQSYAALFWPNHLKRIQNVVELEVGTALVLKFALHDHSIYWYLWISDIEHLCHENNLRNPVYQKMHAVLSERGSILFAACIFGIGALWDASTQSAEGARLLKDPSLINLEGASLLYTAARSGHAREVQALLSNGVSANVRGGFYESPLQAAAFLGHRNILELLLKGGADASANGKFQNALEAAFAGGFECAVSILIMAPYDHYMSTEEVLKAASLHGFHRIIEMITSKEPTGSAQETPSHELIMSELQNSLFKGKIRVAKAWLKELNKIADINAQGGPYGNALQSAAYGGNVKCLHLSLEAGASLHLKGTYGTALRAAALQGKDAAVAILLANGARQYEGIGYTKHFLGRQGDSTQCFAATAAAMNNHHSTVELLCGALGEDEMKSAMYAEALERACARGNDSIVKLLLDWTNPEVYGRDEHQALNEAMFAGRVSTVELFLDRFKEMIPKSQVIHAIPRSGPGRPSLSKFTRRIDEKPSSDVIMSQDQSNNQVHKDEGGGLLRGAARIGEPRLVECLITRAASADGAEDFSLPHPIPRPIEVAAAHGHVDAVLTFLRCGANINHALCFAVRYQRVDVIRAILAYNPCVADVDLRNFPGFELETHHLFTSLAGVERKVVIQLHSARLDSSIYIVKQGYAFRNHGAIENGSAIVQAWKLGLMDIFALLMEHKAESGNDSLPNVSLAFAAYNNDTDLLNLFLNDNRFWPNVPDKSRVLTWAAVAAALNGHWKIVDDVFNRASPMGFDVSAILQLIKAKAKAKYYDLYDLIQPFVDRMGSNLGSVSLIGTALEILKEKIEEENRFSKNHKHHRQMAPETVLVISQNIDNLSQLLSEKMQVGIMKGGELTFLISAVEDAFKNKLKAVSEMIVRQIDQQRKIFSNASHIFPELIRSFGTRGDRPFETASSLAKLILAHGADLNGHDKDGRTALFEACLKGNSELIAFLIDLGANINESYSVSDLPPIFLESWNWKRHNVATLPDQANILYIAIKILLCKIGSKILYNISPIAGPPAELVSRLLYSDLSIDPEIPEFGTLLQIATYQNAKTIAGPMMNRMRKHCLLNGRDFVEMLDHMAILHAEALACRKDSVENLVAMGLNLNRSSCILPLFDGRAFTAVSIMTHIYALTKSSKTRPRNTIVFNGSSWGEDSDMEGFIKVVTKQRGRGSIDDIASFLLQLTEMSPQPLHWRAAFSFTAITGQSAQNLAACRKCPDVEQAEKEFQWVSTVIQRGELNILRNIRTQKLAIPLTTYQGVPLIWEALAVERWNIVNFLFEDSQQYIQLDMDLLSVYFAERLDIKRLEQIKETPLDANQLFTFAGDFVGNSVKVKRNLLSIICDGAIGGHLERQPDALSIKDRAERLIDLLNRGADTACPGLNNTALGHLLNSCNLKQVDETLALADILISYGADINGAKDVILNGVNVRDSPVHQFIRATRSGDQSALKVLQWMSSQGADFNANGGFGTPLHLANVIGHKTAVEFLSEMKAVNAPGVFPVEDVFHIGGWWMNLEPCEWSLYWAQCSHRASDAYPNIRYLEHTNWSHAPKNVAERIEVQYKRLES